MNGNAVYWEQCNSTQSNKTNSAWSCISALQGRLHAERATVNGNAVCAMCMHRNSDDMHQDLIQKKIVHAATTSELQ